MDLAAARDDGDGARDVARIDSTTEHVAHAGRPFQGEASLLQTDRRSMEVTVAAEPFESEDAQRLIEALDHGLAQLYTPEQRFGPNFKPAQIADGRGVFLVARRDGAAVGCGGIRLLDDATAEVKRMYVEPELRGRGVGRQVLDALEAHARELGVRRLVLETGIHQHAAIALYVHAGFAQCDCWGEYLSSPTSVCYSKEIVAP